MLYACDCVLLSGLGWCQIYNDQLSDLLEEEDGDVVTSGSTQAQLALTMNEKRGFMADLR